MAQAPSGTTGGGGGTTAGGGGGGDMAMAPGSPGSDMAGPMMSMPPMTGAPIDTSGSLTADTTWSGSYHMTADVIVPAGKTLTIAAGAQITAEPAVGLRVDGKLVVAGTGPSVVLFTQAGTKEWYGLDIRSGGQLALSYATVEHVTYGVNCEAGAAACQADHATFQSFSDNGVHTSANATFDHIRVELGGSDGFNANTDGITVTITNSTFHQTGGDAVWMEKGTLDFEHNDVYGNVVGGLTADQHCAIHLAGTGTFTVKSNDFYKSVYGFMASQMGAASVVSGNNFYDNGNEWGASVTDSNLNPVGVNAAVQLGGNYWGGSVPSIPGNATVNPATASTFAAAMIAGTGPQ
jgi:Right handed beta helix region